MRTERPGRRNAVSRWFRRAASPEKLISTYGIAVVLALLGEPAVAGPARFERETITIQVKPGGIRVEGQYTFTSAAPTPVSQTVYYPFPIDSLHPLVDSVSVRIGGSDIEYKKAPMGIGFTVPIAAAGSTTVVVSYYHGSLDNTACYILTSTEAWNAPLKEARFEVHVPDSLELVDSSFDFDSVATQGSGRVHRFTQSDFMPENDLCIRWRPVKH
ncbi:MAG: DUF4424 family protein [Candidatus Latescibacterota bacterium]|nr:MAG: DUF4424 family protein [Candidatus Latescibacterota bacterium]